MNYTLIQKKAAEAIKKAGTAATFMRNDVSIGSTYAVESISSTQNDARTQSSLLAQTALTTKQFIVAVMQKTPEVDDTITFNQQTYTVRSIRVFAPSGIPLYYRVEVI